MNGCAMRATRTDRPCHDANPSYQAPPRNWAKAHFAGARMKDRRRTARVEAIAAATANRPGRPPPHLFQRQYDDQAPSDLYDRSEATPDAIQAGHRRTVRSQLR